MMEREITGQRSRGAQGEEGRRGRGSRSRAPSRRRGWIRPRRWPGRRAPPQITGEGGAIIFEQRDVEVPKSWSMLATNVVASKYFRGHARHP